MKKKVKKAKKKQQFDLNNLTGEEIEECSIDLAQSLWPFLSTFFKKRYDDEYYTAYSDTLLVLIKVFSYFLSYFKGSEIIFNADHADIKTYFENPEAIEGFKSAITDCESWYKEDDTISDEIKKNIETRIREIQDIIETLPVYDDEEDMKKLLENK